MDLASWLRHEEIKSVELKRYREEEIHTLSRLGIEVPKLEDILAIHDTLSIDQDVVPNMGRETNRIHVTLWRHLETSGRRGIPSLPEEMAVLASWSPNQGATLSQCYTIGCTL
jgi:hypothetical protein